MGTFFLFLLQFFCCFFFLLTHTKHTQHTQHTDDNFFVYGGNGMKNDFGGHDNYHLNNIYAYVGRAVGLYDAPMLNGHEDHFSKIIKSL